MRPTVNHCSTTRCCCADRGQEPGIVTMAVASATAQARHVRDVFARATCATSRPRTGGAYPPGNATARRLSRSTQCTVGSGWCKRHLTNAPREGPIFFDTTTAQTPRATPRCCSTCGATSRADRADLPRSGVLMPWRGSPPVSVRTPGAHAAGTAGVSRPSRIRLVCFAARRRRRLHVGQRSVRWNAPATADPHCAREASSSTCRADCTRASAHGTVAHAVISDLPDRGLFGSRGADRSTPPANLVEALAQRVARRWPSDIERVIRFGSAADAMHRYRLASLSRGLVKNPTSAAPSSPATAGARRSCSRAHAIA